MTYRKDLIQDLTDTSSQILFKALKCFSRESRLQQYITEI